VATRPLMTDQQEKAATAAIQLLTQALLDPNSAMAEMARALNRDEVKSRPSKLDPDHMNKFQPSEKRPDDGIFTKAMDLFSGRLLAVLGPLAILGGIISSAGSGFQVLVTAMNLLTAVLAPILLPLFVVLAVAVAEFALALQQHVGPALKSLYAFVLEYVLPVFKTLAQVVGHAIGYLVDFGAALIEGARTVLSWAGDVGDWISEKAGDAADWVGEQTGDIFSFGGTPTGGSTAFDLIRGAMGGKGAGTGAGDFSGERGAGGFDEAAPKVDPILAEKIAAGKDAGKAGDVDTLQLVIASLERSVGPKAQIAGISQAFKNAQLAAINADPLEELAKRAVLQAVQELKEIAANTRAGGVGY
jgi:hypothetical protein